MVVVDSWLPVSYRLPDGAYVRRALFGSANWQIFETNGGGRALVARDDLVRRWLSTGLVEEDVLSQFLFGGEKLWGISSRPSQVLSPVAHSSVPITLAEALAFAQALKASREIDPHSAFQDAIYVEKISRLLPTYSISSRTEDEVVLGYWITGGVSVSIKSLRRVRQLRPWGHTSDTKQIIEAAGFSFDEESMHNESDPEGGRSTGLPRACRVFANDAEGVVGAIELYGRPALSSFFNEHIIDIIQNRERYKALGVTFPSAVVLHGPPGCGKTFAVERLVEFLGWPLFEVDASSVASPYVHETSRKIAAVFDEAIRHAPSILVIDEMEAFLADRDIGSGHHRVEEVAEFLRRIPEAGKNEVLVVGMTNRIDMIDPAILRRGRFDHVISVDYPTEEEVRSLLNGLLSSLPIDESVDTGELAARLAGRPLSDVAFIVREGARLAARDGKLELDQASLLTALMTVAPREAQSNVDRRIGFV